MLKHPRDLAGRQMGPRDDYRNWYVCPGRAVEAGTDWVKVLITIRSLLDNSPYKHEPNQRDNPAFNQYVQYTTWQSLLLDHVNHERDAVAKAFLEKHISQHGTEIIDELKNQAKDNAHVKELHSPYGQYGGKCRAPPKVDYAGLSKEVVKLVDQCHAAEASRQAALACSSLEQVDTNTTLNNTDETETDTKRRKVLDQSSPQLSALLSATDYTDPISATKSPPADTAKSQPKGLQRAAQPSLLDMIAVSPSLKRKHDVIDLT